MVQQWATDTGIPQPEITNIDLLGFFSLLFRLFPEQKKGQQQCHEYTVFVQLNLILV